MHGLYSILHIYKAQAYGDNNKTSQSHIAEYSSEMFSEMPLCYCYKMRNA